MCLAIVVRLGGFQVFRFCGLQNPGNHKNRQKPETNRQIAVNTFDIIRINKGQNVLIPISVINQSKALWGEDALEFKFVFFSFPFPCYFKFEKWPRFRPERWEKVPEAVTAVPGVWGIILSFMGGPCGCIGYRFALAE